MTDLLDIGSRACIVCGNPDFHSFEDKQTTFEICLICGCESGYEYDTDASQEHQMALLRTWLIEGSGQWFRGTPPNGWTASKQLKDAGLPIPEEPT